MDAVEDIKSRLDIADAIQEYLPLKPAGTGSFKGLCPFHQEKSPSFFANRPRQSWHCFGCNEGGDVISFVMRMEGMDFREALEFLAQKTGVTLPSYNPEQQTLKRRLIELNDLAARWFQATLRNDPRAEVARKYLMSRGVDDLTADLWRLGFAPDSWDELTNALKSNGATDDELVQAGLAAKSDRGSGVYDRFRGRVMFPIADLHGRIVGFTGRILADVKEAKYVNTPETHVYKKSAVLYGLDKAKGEIKKQGMAVIVEGNMDALSSHQFGVTNVVASSGTALTEDQLLLLRRYTDKLAIAFDGDKAGDAATLRGLDLARNLDFNLRVISIPPESGKDPDDVVRKDVSIWTKIIAEARPIVDWLYARAFAANDVTRPEGKKEIARALLTEFRRINDPVERDAWITKLGNDLEVSTDALRDVMHRSSIDTSRRSGHSSPRTQPQPSDERDFQKEKTRFEHLEDRLEAILYVKPQLKSCAEEILGRHTFKTEQSPEKLDLLAVIADREFEDQSDKTLERELRETAAEILRLKRAEEGLLIEREMREAERQKDDAKIAALIQRLRDL